MRFFLGALALLAAMPTPVPAQHEGPLVVKPRPRRPPRAEPPPEPRAEPAKRPQLKRKSEAEAPKPAAEGPCPAGYIAVDAAPSGDERPPVLRRGGSAEGKAPPKEPEPRVECVFAETVVDEDGHVIEERGGEAAGPSGDPFIEAARAAVFEFSETLPDFTCRQVTTRYSSSSRGEKWKRRDRIEADVLFLRGRERYQNIRRNGKPVKKDPRYSGSWSLGQRHGSAQSRQAPESGHAVYPDIRHHRGRTGGRGHAQWCPGLPDEGQSGPAGSGHPAGTGRCQ